MQTAIKNNWNIKSNKRITKRATLRTEFSNDETNYPLEELRGKIRSTKSRKTLKQTGPHDSYQ